MTIAVEAIKPYISLKENMRAYLDKEKILRKKSLTCSDCKALAVVRFVLGYSLRFGQVEFEQIDISVGSSDKHNISDKEFVMRRIVEIKVRFIDILLEKQTSFPEADVSIVMEMKENKDSAEMLPWNPTHFYMTVVNHPLIKDSIELDLVNPKTPLAFAVLDFVNKYNNVTFGYKKIKLK